MHEVQLMKLVQHPNIVNLIEVIASKDSIFLVMEYVIGGDLFEHIVQNGAMEVSLLSLQESYLEVAIMLRHMSFLHRRDIAVKNWLRNHSSLSNHFQC